MKGTKPSEVEAPPPLRTKPTLPEAQRQSFSLTPEELHELVNDGGDGAAKRLASLGGLKGLAMELKTDLARGIDVHDAHAVEERKSFYSVNELPEVEETTFLDMVWEALEDRMLQILIVSAVLSLALGLTVPDQQTGLVDYAHGWIEGAAILLSVTLVTVVSSVNNYEKEQKFKELTKATPPVKVQVIRSGETLNITDKELLSGDLLNVSAGDVMTVDALVLRSTSLKVDESAATGENDDVAKSAHGDFVMRSGTNVTEGEGTVLVMGVGIHSFAGRIAMQVREAKEETPLQEKLTELADLIGYFGMVAAALMFVLLSGKELVDTVVYHKHGFGYKKYLDNLTTAVTIVVVAVPEGLPLSVTIALAYSMKQMFKENNLVRHLAACETMGGATTICTDKTGTITQNDMCVTDGVTSYGTAYVVPRKMADGEKRVPSPGSEMPAGATSDLLSVSQNSAVRRLLMECITMNTKSTRARVETPNARHTAVHLTGSKTEQALLSFVEVLGEDPMALRAERLGKLQESVMHTPSSPFTPVPWPAGLSNTTNNVSAAAATFTRDLHIYPFTSARKRMSTALVLRPSNTVRYYVKGASELILAECSHTFDAQGERVVLSHDVRVRLEEAIMSMARRQLRTLAIAYADHPMPAHAHKRSFSKGGDSAGDRKSSGEDDAEDDFASTPFLKDDANLQDLTLVGIVGIQDPVRLEVPGSVAQCRRAGVVVRMITGDNKATAVSIAKEVGIYGKVWTGPHAGEQGLALEGPQFRELAKSARKLNAILPQLQVISRASPLDKRILVSALMERGEVVAVTGDGTNDAPALKGANVGFSMNSGTEVAKLASDVVILDDNFSTIVTAMKWGRNVNDNISKFLQFQMTVNVAAVIVSFLGALLDGNGESPLKPVQLLWLNLIMDTLAALALATETPSDDVLLRPPKAKAAPLITRRMWLNIGGQSLYQIVVQLWLLHDGAAFFGVRPGSEEHLTVIFNTFVLMQLSNEFNARILDNAPFVWHNIRHAPMFLVVVLSTFVIQILAVQYGGALMRCVPLTAGLWQKCFVFAVVPLPLGIVLRRLHVGEAAVPPPPVVLDDAEEAALRVEQQQRKRPTLACVARKVLTQLLVVRCFQENLQERKQPARKVS